MSSLLDLFNGDFSYRLVVMLLHFVWQGAVLWAFAYVGTRILRSRDPRFTYALNVAVLLLMVGSALALVTFALVKGPGHRRAPLTFRTSASSTDKLHPDRDSTTEVVPVVLPAITEVESHPVVSRTSATNWQAVIVSWSPSIAAGYVFVVAGLLLRLAFGMWQTHLLRRTAFIVECRDVLTIAHEQAQRVGLATTPLIAWCERISVPIVTGVVRPMILLPAAFIGGMTTTQIESILTHEMAHIRRFDLWISLLQRVIELTFFFHPAVWFVSRRIDIEREKVADDVALRAGCEAAQYADALLHMAQLSSDLRNKTANTDHGFSGIAHVDSDVIRHPGSALAMTGHRVSGLKVRVLRILGTAHDTAIRSRSTFPALGATVVLSVIFLATTVVAINGKPR